MNIMNSMNMKNSSTNASTMADGTSNARPTVAASGVPTIDPATLSTWLRDGSCVLVDVREPDEHARERIKEAASEPLSSLDARRLAQRATQGRSIVLHCKGGRRSADAVAQVLAQAPAGAAVFSLAGGIEAWRSKGLPTEVDARVARLSVMRQVQITIGVGALAGSALAWFVHPAFVVIPAFLGAGLTFAGATGTCGLALLIERMPWNRIPSASCNTARN